MEAVPQGRLPPRQYGPEMGEEGAHPRVVSLQGELVAELQVSRRTERTPHSMVGEAGVEAAFQGWKEGAAQGPTLFAPEVESRVGPWMAAESRWMLRRGEVG